MRDRQPALRAGLQLQWSFIAVIPVFSHEVFVAQASFELTAVLPQFPSAGITGVSSHAQFAMGQTCAPLTADKAENGMGFLSVQHPPLCLEAGSWEKVAQTLRAKP